LARAVADFDFDTAAALVDDLCTAEAGAE
jgi:hypothetical protein